MWYRNVNWQYVNYILQNSSIWPDLNLIFQMSSNVQQGAVDELWTVKVWAAVRSWGSLSSSRYSLMRCWGRWAHRCWSETETACTGTSDPQQSAGETYSLITDVLSEWSCATPETRVSPEMTLMRCDALWKIQLICFHMFNTYIYTHTHIES